MRSFLLAFVLVAPSAGATVLPPVRTVEPTAFFRTGFDSNPDGTGGTSAAVLGSETTMVYAGGAGISLEWSAPTPARPFLKLAYAGEVVRFDRWSGEDFVSHRFSLGGQTTAGGWRLTADGSSLYIAGSRDTLAAVSSVNANGMALWRDRRRQWQHRLKLQALKNTGTLVTRGTASLLAYDYQTDVVAGKVAFADRSDAQAAVDFGWQQGANSLWFFGIRGGRQIQAIVPLPNCDFDYSNNYGRLAAGWEGKPTARVSLAFAAGPDFRRYSGQVDPRVFSGERDRTSLWFEGSLSAKLTPTITLAGKAARTTWLSGTGKSAYYDSSLDGGVSWAANSAWTLRLTAKLHRCDYFPVERDDWELLLGAGAVFSVSHRAQLAVDVLRHRAWNHLPAVGEREFHRFVANVGLTIKI